MVSLRNLHIFLISGPFLLMGFRILIKYDFKQGRMFWNDIRLFYHSLFAIAK